jgi:hypothetical protein
VPLIPYLAAEHVGLSEGAVQAVRGVEPASLAATAPPPTYEPPVEPPAPPVESPREEELYE